MRRCRFKVRRCIEKRWATVVTEQESLSSSVRSTRRRFSVRGPKPWSDGSSPARRVNDISIVPSPLLYPCCYCTSGIVTSAWYLLDRLGLPWCHRRILRSTEVGLTPDQAHSSPQCAGGHSEHAGPATDRALVSWRDSPSLLLRREPAETTVFRPLGKTACGITLGPREHSA